MTESTIGPALPPWATPPAARKPSAAPAAVRFAFYGRVSTEDNQDPQSSRDWQYRAAETLIAPHGGVIVAEYFDIGDSRAVPWDGRPQAAQLLKDVENHSRPFQAVVIGEPQRAFYAEQFKQIFHRLTYYRVDLWVPQVGGYVDPNSDAHDLVMTIYGGISKSERRTVQSRVKESMEAQTINQGRFEGGRPPYGYRIVALGPHPHPRKAAEGLSLKGLEPDPTSAPVVVRIFAWYINGAGLRTIARRLNEEGIPCPSAADPERNTHRSGDGWQPATVRAILENPRYTGHQVWNRWHREEDLADPRDPAAGSITRFRRTPADQHVISIQPSHVALITHDTFIAARQRMRQRDATSQRAPRSSDVAYQLRGRLFCAICMRRMQGNVNNKRVHYRCRRSDQVPGAGQADHPKTAYVREDHIVPKLDAWVAELFAPDTLADTIRAMTQAQEESLGLATQRRDLARKVQLAEKKLSQHRRALEQGGDPAWFVPWINEAASELDEARAAQATLPASSVLSEQEVAALVTDLGGIATALRDADPAEKASLYEALNLTLVYSPADRSVTADIGACASQSVRGGT